MPHHICFYVKKHLSQRHLIQSGQRRRPSTNIRPPSIIEAFPRLSPALALEAFSTDLPCSHAVSLYWFSFFFLFLTHLKVSMKYDCVHCFKTSSWAGGGFYLQLHMRKSASARTDFQPGLFIQFSLIEWPFHDNSPHSFNPILCPSYHEPSGGGKNKT